MLLIPFFAIVGFEFVELFNSPELAVDYSWDLSPWVLLLILPSLLFYFLFSFSVPLVWFYNIEAINALKYSCKFLWKHLLIYILFCIVVFLLAISGIIGLLIAVLITFTFVYPMMYECFSDLTFLEEYENPSSD